jgi:hypothetical protein
MFRNLKIGTKILIAFAPIAITAVTVIGFFAYTTGKSVLEEESFNKLTAIREMKAGQVEAYFRLISDQAISLSENRMTVDAMKEFASGFDLLADELDIPRSELESIEEGVSSYYEDQFIEQLVPNLLAEVSASEYMPESETTQLLQFLYIISNQNIPGLKYFLNNAGDGSSYSGAHEIYNPIFRSYLTRFGYSDIYLVDLQGNIVYSVFKSVDYGTSLETGPYGETNFAEAFKLAREGPSRTFSELVDFQPYQPAYNAPAAFIASPIYDGYDKIGVLAFQMPVNRINDIMTSNQNWADVGLGQSGETYIIGDDFTLRNQSRFLIEDRENYIQTLKDVDVPIPTVARIDSLNTSIGLQPVNTEGGSAALRGEDGTAIFPDYRNVSVLSAFRPLDIPDVNWAIMSEIDEAEAFSDVSELGNRILAFLLVTIIGIITAAIWFSRSLTNPLKLLTGYSRALSKHEFGRDKPFEYSAQLANISAWDDEIGDLAGAFQVMQGELDHSISNLIETTAEKERIEGELEVARDIQLSILPRELPENPEWEFGFHFLSMEAVGGDFYDVIELGNGKYGVALGDVSGHGVPAALFMALTATLLRAEAKRSGSPGDVLRAVNGQLLETSDSGMFVTVLYGILDSTSNVFQYARAGHSTPIIANPGQPPSQLEHGLGLPMGIFDDMVLDEGSIPLHPDSLVVLYTDGVTEAANAQNDFFGESGLLEVVGSSEDRQPEAVCQRIWEAVRAFQGAASIEDDITLLAVRAIRQ